MKRARSTFHGLVAAAAVWLAGCGDAPTPAAPRESGAPGSTPRA